MRRHGVVTDTLMRAVHTLAGTSGTVRIAALSDLGYAFEKALQKLATSELSEEEQSLVGEAIDTIEAMVSKVIELRVPDAVPQLVARLEHIGAQAGATQESMLEEAADLACFTRPRRNKPLLQPGFAGRPGSPEPRPFPGIGDRQAVGTGSAGNMDLEKRAVKGRKGAY